MNDFAIELNHVTKRFGSKVAVDNLCLRVRESELFAFLGPNGAGKTTTIKMICGLLRPSSGTVRVAGFDVVREGELARSQLAYVPDEPYLYEKLTGREFLMLICRLYGMSDQVARRRIEEVVELFDMAGYIDHLTETYSHGMKQRVVFGAALVRDPDVLVVDEPLVGLDPLTARLVKELLRRRARGGRTVFMSTHTLSVAEEIADRIGILHRGRLLWCGTLEELRAARQSSDRLEDIFLRLIAEEGGSVPASVMSILESR